MTKQDSGNDPTTLGDGIWSPAQTYKKKGDEGDVVFTPGSMTRVSDVMTTDIYAVAPDTGLETAARLMVNRRITGLPVVQNATPIGVVTLSDLVDPDKVHSDADGYPVFYHFDDAGQHEVGDDVHVAEGRVADVMSPFVLSVAASATLVEAAKRMLAESVHRLLVRDGAELVGIVTVTDLLRGFTKQYG
jgi:CBS domain-containing protein